MWAWTAINDTSSVVAAGQTWAGSHGNDVALNYATIVIYKFILVIANDSYKIAIIHYIVEVILIFQKMQ